MAHWGSDNPTRWHTSLSLNTTQEVVWIFWQIFIHTTKQKLEFALTWMRFDIYTHTVGLCFHEQHSREGFCSQTHLWDSLFCAMRTFFSLPFSPSFSYSLQFPAALLSLSVSHSSTSHFWPTLEVSGFYSWFTLAPPSHKHPPHPTPLSLCVPLLSFFLSLLLLLYLMLTSAFPGRRWGLQWAERGGLILTHSCNISSTSSIPNSYVLSSLPLILLFFCAISLLLPLHLPLLKYNPTTTSSSSHYSSLRDA